MNSIWDHANPALRDFKVYEPGKPIEETARELGSEAHDIIKLASNENPLGPSPKASQRYERRSRTRIFIRMAAVIICEKRWPNG